MSNNAIASSSKTKSNSKEKKISQESTHPLSREIIDSETDSESDDEDNNGDEDEESEVDSEGDIDAVVTQKQKSTSTPIKIGRPGKSLPKYVPPPGMSPIGITTTFTTSPFTYENLSTKSGVELWCIRVPQDFKPSRLSNLNLKVQPTISGTLKTKHHTYELVSAGTSSTSHTMVDGDGRHPTAGPGLIDAMTMDIDGIQEVRAEGGEEMSGGMRLLVPKVENGGKLFVAPIPIKHHLLLTPQSLPTPVEEPSDPRPFPSFLSTTIPDSTESLASIHPESVLPNKRPQPTHLMKFRNKAFGFDTPGPLADLERQTIQSPGAEKRKTVEERAPKKSKKLKQSA